MKNLYSIALVFLIVARVAGIDLTVTARSRPDLRGAGGIRFSAEVPASLSFAASLGNGLASSVEFGMKTGIDVYRPAMYRGYLSADFLSATVRYGSPRNPHGLNFGLSYQIPARAMGSLAVADIADDGSYQYVSLFAGLSRVIDPGALTAAVQWTIGLPQRYVDHPSWHLRPGLITVTMLVTEAIHRSLACIVGVRGSLDFGEVAWPIVSFPIPVFSNEVVLMVQIGDVPIRYRVFLTAPAAEGAYGFEATMEVEYAVSL